MAGQGVELATAWVRLVPSMEGATDNITKALAPGTKAASAEGDKAGKGWSKRAKAAIGAAAIGTAITGAFTGLYKIGSTFDSVTDTIRTGTGASGDALSGLADVAKGIGKRIPVDFDAAAASVAALNTATGATGPGLENLSTQVLEASRLLGEDGVANAEAYGKALNQWGVDADTGADALDGLFKVTQDYGVTLSGLTGNLNTYGSVLQNAGFTMDESAVLFGSLQKGGIDVSRVMPGLNKSFRDWASAGKDVQSELGSTVDQIANAESSTKALAIATDVFGAEGAQRMTTAIRNGSFALGDLDGALEGSAGLIKSTGEEQMSFSERWQQTMNTAMVAIEPLATAVFAALSDGLEAAMPTLQALGEWVGANIGTIGVIAGVIGGTLVAAFVAWTVSIWASTAAMLANPLTWIILAVIALIAAVVALVMNWDEVVAWITEVWGGFITWISEVIAGFVAWWNGVWEGFAAWIGQLWQGLVNGISAIWSGFVGWLRGIVDGIVSWWNGIWTGVGNFFSDLWAGIVAYVTNYINTVRSIIMSVVNTIVSWWNGMWTGVGNFFRGIWNGLVSVVRGVGTAFSNVFNGIRNAISAAFSGIVSIVKAPINAIIGLVNGAIGALNGLSVTIPDWVPGIGGSSFGVNLPRIPQLAEGATVLPRAGGTLAVLAEAGRPESVVDTGLMNRALEQGLGGTNGSEGMVVQGPLVHVDEMVVDSDDRVDEVAQALWERGERAQRAKGKVNLEGAVSE